MDAQESEIAEIGRRAAEAQERLKHVAATASSTDGAVTLTVNTAGALQKLDFGASADEMPRAALAAAVLATARRAQVRAAEQLSDIMAPVIGEHSEAMKFLEEQIPKPDESEEEADSADTRPRFRARPATDDDYFDNGPLLRRD
ncbi:YbaB/EbfC family DNA-binding protein [Amycolatopsis panacis]|uniref:YbaB/EbfC family DNA-binding protein n=2 Tax=Amycolatopsis panacis TaxID=2340917 RepID=A0A419IBP7_9PSEU|nr:YbaB/EbfC family DNA-binding protein [Amycolatopsis panacis]